MARNGSTGQVKDTAENAAARADRSTALDRGVRVGLIAYGITHLLIAALALSLVRGGGGDRPASQQGAFAQLGSSGWGTAVLLLVAAGFAALVVWQLVEAVVGHRDSDGAARIAKRVASGVKAVVYGVLAASALQVALGSGGSGSSKDAWTARVMQAPGGRWLVGAAGLGLVAVGGWLAWRGLSERFRKRLDAGATTGDSGTAVVWLGKIGYVAKGLALGAVGSLFVTAAVRQDPQQSGGLDVALRELLRQPLGPVLVLGIALGLGAFGVYCFAWARHLRR